MRRPALAVQCAVLVSAACSEPALTPPYPSIDPEQIRTHLDRLTGAEDSGVEPGSPGEELALEYLTGVFTEIGLSVQEQPVHLTKITPTTGELQISGETGDRTLQLGDDFVAWTRRHVPNTSTDAEMVFVRYGISTPHHEWDDYKDLNVEGKILLMLIGDPHVGTRHLLGTLGRDIYGRRAYKFEEAERRGAAGAFLIHVDDQAREPWELIERVSKEVLDVGAPEETTTHLPVEGWITEEVAAEVFGDAGLDFEHLRRLAEEANFNPVSLPLRASIDIQNEIAAVTSTNLVATLDGEGVDPEYVLYSSHWNDLPAGAASAGHLTDGTPGNQPPGVAAVLEVARALSREPTPQRSIVFLIVTAESEGLLGLDYYLDHPIYPIARTRAALHMAGFSRHAAESHVSIIGFGFEALKGLVRERASEQFRIASADMRTAEQK